MLSSLAALLIGMLTTLNSMKAQVFGGITELKCDASYTKDVYDTPTGDVTPGYYDPVRNLGNIKNATTGEDSIIATVISTASYEVCNDVEGKRYEYTITSKQLTDFRDSKPLPAKSVQLVE